MLTVLIADDEYFIRQRLIKIIDWERLELEFIGEAENGNEVIEKIDSNQVDILMLDIKMPIKSGIEVAEHIMTNNIKTKIIILTGYNDFDYAQKAVKFKVEDYLLKPINKDTLNEALLSCKNTILKSLEKQKKIYDYNNYQKHIYLYNTILDFNNIHSLYKEYPDFKNYHSLLFIGVFYPNDHDNYIASFISYLAKCFNELNKETIFAQSYKESESISIIQLITKSKTAIKVNYIKEMVIDYITKDNYVFIAIGDFISIKENWTKNYKLVWNLLYQRYFIDDNIILSKKLSSPNKNKYKTITIRKNLLLCLNSKNYSDLKKLINDIFINIRKNASKDYLILSLTEIFVTLQIHFPDQINSKSINSFVQELISENYSLQYLQDTVNTYSNQCMDYVNHEKPSNTSLVNRVIKYIQKNYTDPFLSVAEISDFFELTPTYLGSIFKKIAGQSILQYITELRMEQAKKLLNTNKYNVTEISQMVGYSDVFYFSKKFKKIHGCSPKHYSS
ncbi:response regulator transcription factor [Vallitalea maricola]|uniref:Response regulator transcription factor n=1 Tax=Vallitalea maricola TaxID=3074433 RepID=A0ACB5UPJ6_9FIRM|nr:response regulator transcription factor [Vallitalea sp. AN17-2]